LRLRLGSQAADYARQYSWENIVDRLMTVYDKLLI
jgi:hypothetical protein